MAIQGAAQKGHVTSEPTARGDRAPTDSVERHAFVHGRTKPSLDRLSSRRGARRFEGGHRRGPDRAVRAIPDHSDPSIHPALRLHATCSIAARRPDEAHNELHEQFLEDPDAASKALRGGCSRRDGKGGNACPVGLHR
jgi:hypothetical protein